MRKIEFLNDLENALKLLKVAKVDEILRDYEEIFIEGAQAGQTEEQIIESLDDPLEIALNYCNSSTNRNIKEEKSIIIPEHNIPAFKPSKTFANEVK